MKYKTCSVELKFDVTGKEDDITSLPSRDELRDSFSEMLKEWEVMKGFSLSRVLIDIAHWQ